MLPNFLIIGEARCGTTALWHFLRQHPDVYMSAQKEPQFFALNGRRADFRGPGDASLNCVEDYNEYEQLFNNVRGRPAIGEASTWYLSSSNAALAINQLIPDIKLIAILRDPVERAFSHYLLNKKRALEKLPTFHEAMFMEEKRIRELWSPRFHYKKRGFYFKHIGHYLTLFPRDRIKVYLYEDFVNNSDAMFSDIFNYLGVEPLRVDVRERIHDSRLPRSKTLDRIVRNGHALTRALKPLLPPNLRHRVKQAVGDLNRWRPRLSASDREKFITIYQQDILQLSALLKRDLSMWLEA
jgi:hypothetical protein